MIKKVALAIRCSFPATWQPRKAGDCSVEEAEAMARAAIAAMREPTKEMLKTNNFSRRALLVWQPMIDAALKESGEAE